MKLKELLEADIVRFPSERRGYYENPVTGQWERGSDEIEKEYHVISGNGLNIEDHSVHDTYRKAEIAIKKLRLKGNHDPSLRILEI